MSTERLISRIEKSKTRPCLYHFTDKSSLQLMKFGGGILSKQYQLEKHISPAFPGGDANSQMSDKIRGNFDNISLCLTNNHPMAYHCRNDGRHPNQTYLRINPQILLTVGTRVALGLANSPMTEVIPISDAFERLDLAILYDNIHHADFFPRISAMEKVEILLPRIVPFSYILGTAPHRR